MTITNAFPNWSNKDLTKMAKLITEGYGSNSFAHPQFEHLVGEIIRRLDQVKEEK